MGAGAGRKAEREAEVNKQTMRARMVEGAFLLVFMMGFVIAECGSFFFGEEEQEEDWS